MPYQLQGLGSEVWKALRLRLPWIAQRQVEFLVTATMGLPVPQGDEYHAWRCGMDTEGTSSDSTNLQWAVGSVGCLKGGHTSEPVVEVSLVQVIGQPDRFWPHPKCGIFHEAELLLLKLCSRVIGAALCSLQLFGTEGVLRPVPGPAARGNLVSNSKQGRPSEVGQTVVGQVAQGTHEDESRVQGKGLRRGKPTSHTVRLPVHADAGWVKVVGGPPGWRNDVLVGPPRKSCINRYSALVVEAMPLPEGSDSRYVACSPPERLPGRFVGAGERSTCCVGQRSRRQRLGPEVVHRSLLEVRRLKNAARRRRRKWHQQFWYGASVVPGN